MAKPKPQTIGEIQRDGEIRVRQIERRGKSPSLPVGGSCIWFTATAPKGYVFAEGQTLNIDDYPVLAALFGTTFGGNGTTTFGVPDMRGLVPVGQKTGTAAFATLNATGGVVEVTLQISEIPAHQHQEQMNANQIAPGGGSAVGGLSFAGGSVPGTPAQQYTGLTGGGGPHTNLQPYRVVKYIIRAA